MFLSHRYLRTAALRLGSPVSIIPSDANVAPISILIYVLGTANEPEEQARLFSILISLFGH